MLQSILIQKFQMILNLQNKFQEVRYLWQILIANNQKEKI
ncbi:unnamed protein product [Paramecium sonneborni]|uniref:Uncharacterized protein n=1 Tax=Paramecium sonneborni TaxID=65129 RepID=A0A8S1N1M2_9CILI|nr:unnamed protein product [Paramecium sonneborni]